MSGQLDLFAWADARPSNVIDAMPALIRKAAIEAAYPFSRPKSEAKVVVIGDKAA